MLIADYKREEDEEDERAEEGAGEELMDPEPIDSVDLTPKLSLSSLSRCKKWKVEKSFFEELSRGELLSNPRVEKLYAPLVGPSRSAREGGLSAKNTYTGYVEDEWMNERLFERQMTAFAQDGVALDPSGLKWVYNAYREVGEGAEVVREKKRRKEKRLDPTRDPSNVQGFLGTWRKVEEREERGEEERVAMPEESRQKEGEEEEEKVEEEVVCASVWHLCEGEREGWMEVPKSLRGKAQLRSEVQAESVSSQVLKLLKSGRVEEEESGPTNKELIQRIKPVEFDNYLPKKQVHVWSEAKGGVSKSRFFPEYGHLLLSSSMDGKLRVYEAQGRRRCLMTYAAHKHAVRDFDWSPQGSHFISCSYDKTVKLWDTETGQVTMTLDNGSLPIVGRFYPLDSNVFLVGQSDKKIVQWDSRAGQTVQVYNRHLGAVNTITWIDDCRRFVTSSDDKSIRVWEYNIPVDIKYIAEPYMHSMPSITLHSNKKWFLCQSLDNQILVYSTKDRFRLNRKKRFAGHLVAGYACNISVSPDGRCVTSGDSHGNLIFWDWKTTKILKKIKAHDHVSIDVQWHPLEPSRLVSSGWDKVVKLWD